MVVSLTVAMAVMVLAMTAVAVGVHMNDSTFRDRRWNLALQVAESGVERAVAELRKDVMYTGSGGVVAIPGGEFRTTVTVPDTGYRLIDSIGYVPSQAHPNALRRRVQVLYGPGVAFKYALFSESSLTVKNNANPLQGDVWANKDITIDSNTIIKGNVTSAEGWVSVGKSAKIVKDAEGKGGTVASGGSSSGNWGIFLDGGGSLSNKAVVEVAARARRDCTSAPASPGSSHGITNNGDIGQTALLWGPYNGTGTAPPRTFQCEQRAPQQALPALGTDWATLKGEYEKEYGTSVLGVGVFEWASHTQFQTWVNSTKTNLRGVHYVTPAADAQNTNVINLSGTTIIDDFILITNSPLLWDNSASSVVPVNAPSTATINIISMNERSSVAENQTPAIYIPLNDFKVQSTTPPAMPCMLMYSKGKIFIKNNGNFNGAIYGNPLEIKNNFVVTYDPCVERTLGFTTARFARAQWVEVSPGA